jgi:predicted transcriptional regulator of viral defense system
MGDKPAPDAEIAKIAGGQHGAISTTQLEAAGLGRNAVAKRCQAGRLHRLHRGVYAVGHLAPSSERQWMAAVLALGTGAVLSHRSAAALWELLPARDEPVDVSVRGRGGRHRREGIRIHRPESLEHPEISRQRGIPVTSPARTLADLRSVVSARELRRAVRQADFLSLPTGSDVEVDRTRSELERRFLWLCHPHHLPQPAVNLRIGAMTVDFCWVEQRLIVETDGYSAHRGRAAFENDRARDLLLQAHGYRVMRLSYRQVFDEPNGVIAALRPLLIPGARAP